MRMTRVLFLMAWNTSSCVTEVSVKLHRGGFPHMTPARCLRYARVLRDLSEKLKVVPRSDLPAYHETPPVVAPAEVGTQRHHDAPADREPLLITSMSRGSICVHEAVHLTWEPHVKADDQLLSMVEWLSKFGQPPQK